MLIVGGAELALFVATRLIIAHWSAWQWQPELLRTLCRAGVAFLLWHFFRALICSGTPSGRGVRHPLFIAAACLLFSVPLLIGDWAFMGPLTRSVFAATSIVVAIHEEFLFRGIVQNLLARRWGMLKAIGMTSALMTLWHVGALPLTLFNFWQVFAISCMLGLIYAATGSMVLVVTVHALYDAIWSATPVLAKPLAAHWGSILLLASLVLTWLWVRRAYGAKPFAHARRRWSGPRA